MVNSSFLNFIALWWIHTIEKLPAPDLNQWIALLAILVVSAFILNRSIQKEEWRSAFIPFRKSMILDLVGIITVAIFAISALFLTKDMVLPYVALNNAAAVRIDLVWVATVAIILLIYRFLKGEAIPI